jgi:hypothetical protein
VVVPAGDGLVPSAPGGPAQIEGQAGVAGQPGCPGDGDIPMIGAFAAVRWPCHPDRSFPLIARVCPSLLTSGCQARNAEGAP